MRKGKDYRKTERNSHPRQWSYCIQVLSYFRNHYKAGLWGHLCVILTCHAEDDGSPSHKTCMLSSIPYWSRQQDSDAVMQRTNVQRCYLDVWTPFMCLSPSVYTSPTICMSAGGRSVNCSDMRRGAISSHFPSLGRPDTIWVWYINV